MKNFFLFLVCFILFLLISPNAFSQTDDTLKKELPEVIISATRTNKNADSIGRSVSVFSKKEIGELQSNDLASLISLSPGVSVIGADQNPGMNQTLFIRGTNSNQNVILFDGIRISDPSSPANAPDLKEFPLSGLEQVELVRGSHSTLFGSAAMGGTVNLISISPSVVGFHGGIKATGGVFGKSTSHFSEDLYLNYYDRSGFYLSGNFYSNLNDGIDATTDTITFTDAKKYFDNDDFTHLRTGGKAGFKHGKFEVSGQYYYNWFRNDFDHSAFKTNYFSINNPHIYYDGDSTEIHFKRDLAILSASAEISKHWLAEISGAYTVMNREVIDQIALPNDFGSSDSTTISALYNGNNRYVKSQINYNKSNWNGVAGVELSVEQMDFFSKYSSVSAFDSSSFFEFSFADSLLESQATVAGGFLQLDMNGKTFSKKLQRFNFLIGARYDYHNQFGGVLVYEINPSFHIGKYGMFFGSYSTGFNAPSLYQLYAAEANYISLVTRGNPSLDPETSSSAELGYKMNLNNQFQLGISVFHNRVMNAVEFVYLWDASIPIDSLGTDFSRDDYRGDSYINAGELRINGIEINAGIRFSKQISFEGNISLVDGKLLFDPSQLQTEHADSNRIQLYSTGSFLTGSSEETFLTRRPSTAIAILIFQPAEKIGARIVSKWVGEKKDVFYDSEIKPYGALNTNPVSGYFLLDVLIDYRINKYLGAGLKVGNILDSDCTEIRGFNTIGRSAFLTLNAEW